MLLAMALKKVSTSAKMINAALSAPSLDADTLLNVDAASVEIIEAQNLLSAATIMADLP